MQLFFYASRNNKNKKRLEVAIQEAMPGRPIEHFMRLDDFRDRLRAIVEPDSIAVLFAFNHEELLGMQVFSELLPEIYVLLVIPDWQERTVKLAHLLLPRLLSHKNDNFNDLKKVLKKMGRIPHGFVS